MRKMSATVRAGAGEQIRIDAEVVTIDTVMNHL
jgi:hypothetical protein